MKKRLFRCLLVVISVLVPLLLVEVILRCINAWDKALYGDLQARLERSATSSIGSSRQRGGLSGLIQASSYPDIVYELKPGVSGLFLSKLVCVNSSGMRDKEYSTAKPPGTYRIAGLGDSIMFGWGVEQEESYLSILEQRLNDLPGQHAAFEVLNFGVPGYNTAMEAAVLEHKALSFDPDLLIIQFVNNDLGVPSYMLRQRSSLSLRESFLWAFIRRWQGLRQLDDRIVGTGAVERSEVLDRYGYMVGESGYRRAMEKLARLTVARKIPVILIWGTGHEIWGTAFQQQDAMFRDVVKRHGFHLVDVGPYTDAFVRREGIEDTKEARLNALQISHTDRHPTARAHTIYVEALIDQMRKMGIIGMPPSDGEEAKPTPNGVAEHAGASGG